MKNYVKRLLPIAFSVFLAGAALASTLAAPSGPVILTVSGSISEKNAGEVAQFDRSMLRELGWQSVDSYTRWTDGQTHFEGISLASLLDAVGASGKTMVAVALNDYSVRIPVSDAKDHNVLLALEMNGQQMKIRDKGPIWVIYPQTQEQANEPRFDEKMIWQLKSIEIVD